MKKSGDLRKNKVMAWLLAGAVLMGSIGCRGGLAFAAVKDKVTASAGSIDETVPDVDQTMARFKLPEGIENGAVKIVASGDCLAAEVEKRSFEKPILKDDTAVEISLRESLKKGVPALQGEVTYTLTFISENDKSTPETDVLKRAYYRTKDLKVQLQNGTEPVQNKRLIYGDAGDFRIGAVEGSVEGSGFTYEVETVRGNTPEANREKEILKIVDGRITVKNAGTAKVTVTRTRYQSESYDTYWDEAAAEITITVEPKMLDPVKAVTYTQDAEDRIYRANDRTAGAVGVISVDVSGGLEAADAGKLVIDAVMRLDAADAGIYQAAEIAVDRYELAEGTEGTKDEKKSALVNYRLPDADALGKIKRITSAFVVQQKPLTIEVMPKVSRVFFDQIYNKQVKPEVEILIKEGKEDSAVIESIRRNLEIEPLGPKAEVKTYPGEIRVDIDKANAAIEKNQRGSKNYIFKEKGHSWGDLEVRREELKQENLNACVSYGGDNRFYENGRIWVKARGGRLTLSPQNEYADRYDAVFQADDKGDPVYPLVNLTAEGITSESLSKLGKLNICLAQKNEDSNHTTGYRNFSSALEVPFKLDAEAPTVVFEAPLLTEKVEAAGEQTENFVFGLFSRGIYSAGFTVTDLAAAQSSPDQKPGAGVKSVRTCVWKLAEDHLTNGAVHEAEISEKIKTIREWKDAQPQEDGSYVVEVAGDTAGKPDAVEGNYLVLAEVTDRVNNTQIYASNGIVVDVTKPLIQVTFKDGEAYTDSPKPFYAGDITYAISVAEGSGAGVSGVAEVCWEVRCDGKIWKRYSEKTESGRKVFEEDSTVQAYIKEGILQQYTGDKLEKVFSKTDQVIPADECNSNDLVLTVKAKDRAGNLAAEVSYPLCIDATDPAISISYDNNAVKNGKYFRKKRVAEITFRERNFDRSQVTFDLALEDGRKYEKVSLETLQTIKGVYAEWGYDSADAGGAVRKENAAKDTDEHIQIARIYFLGDNTYKGFQVHCKDLAGRTNKGISFRKEQKATEEFVIDTTAPRASVRYFADGQEILPGKKEDGRIYKNKVITAVIGVEEHNFALDKSFADGQVVYEINGTKTEEGRRIANYQKQANILKKWTSDGDLRTAEAFVYAVDANYTAGFQYTDLAGNSCALSKDFFTVDRTAPEGTITVGSIGTWKHSPAKITFGLFGSTSQKVSLTGYDHTSPVISAAYVTSHEPMRKTQVAAVKNWRKGRSFRKAANQQFLVYFRIIDKAGNITYLSSDGIVLDSEKPGLDITITASGASHGVYAENVPFTIRVEDPEKGKTCAGLKSVSYEILNQGKVTQSGNFDDALKPASKRVTGIKRNLSVDASRNNSNDVTIRVTAVDHAGNTASKTKRLRIDITKPEISVSYNNNSPQNGRFYRDIRVAAITIRERNFDPDRVRFEISKPGGTGPMISGWTDSRTSGASDLEEHTCTISFVSDGDYSFTLECTDLAGNRAVYGKTDVFTIDRTVPEIHVSYDHHAVSGGCFYRTERTATVTVTEHNFYAAGVKESIIASLNGQGIRAPSLSEFSSKGDTHTAVVHFSASGDYTFRLSCTDLAGNPAQSYGDDRFTIDLEKPVIKISGIEKANKGAVNPVIEVTDNNYDASGVTVTLEGTKQKDRIKEDSRSPMAFGERICLADLPHREDVDDIYTLTVHAADRAGNTGEEKLTFSVNRFGSVYTMDESTERLMEKYYTNRIEDLTVTETNTDTLRHRKITCSRDGEIYDMKEGKDYILEESGAPGNWRVYTYRILKKNFEKDGTYCITIYSEDEAQNSSSNQGKQKQIEFAVDRTAPTIVITGIENGAGYRENSRIATVDAKDNIYLKSLRVEIQKEGAAGASVYEFAEEELERGYGVVTQAVKSANDWQTLKAVALDAAGNKGESEMFRVLVTSNLWIQFYRNKPLFFGSILIFLLILFLIETKIALSAFRCYNQHKYTTNKRRAYENDH